MRTFGVEEELLLVDEQSGAPLPVARRVLADHRVPRLDGLAEHGMTGELQQEMIEVLTAPHTSLADLAADIREGRACADASARAAGARAVPLATSPLPVEPHLMPKLRYLQMRRRYGLTTRHSLTCGMHVHVAVQDDSEGVAVLDRIRVWLPVLLALSSNSPFFQGEDTGHASFRYTAWLRWPSGGPTEIFGTAADYQRHEQQLLASGVLLDGKMIYSDARLSRSHPTVEIRIADICLSPDSATLVAALARALVETAAREGQDGVAPVPASGAVLRLASWKAAIEGLRGELVHPIAGVPRPARQVVEALVEHVTPSLIDSGDWETVDRLVADVLASGTGADRQRAAFAQGGRLSDIIADAIAVNGTGPHLLEA
jgi:carboxylate-amine ligase